MSTIDVTDANGIKRAIEKPLIPGRAPASASRPIALSNEDLAAITALAAALGEVQVSPTANTVLDRLKTVATALAAISGYVDGLEGLATTLNTYVDGLETLITATNTKSDTLHTDLTSANAVLGTPAGTAVVTDANGTMQQYLRGLVSQWAAGTLVIGAGIALIGRAVADASASTGGIASTARLASSAASTNATRVKATPGRVYNVQGYNAATYTVYLVLYDSAASPPVPGTTTIRKKIPLPPMTAFALDWPVGLSFAAGIGFALVKLAADADTTAVAAGDIVQLNIDYV